jgi:hypothetical protein
MLRITKRKRARIPITTPKPRSSRVAEAYERLGVKEKDVKQAPIITHILNELPGKTKKAIEFLRGSSEPEARKWLAVYDSMAVSFRSLVPFEAFCLAANLTTKRVLELITGACFEQSANVSSLIAKAEHPAVVKATVRAAKKPGGDSDRKMLHLHEGFVPVPKTSVVNVQGDLNANTDNRIQSVSITTIDGINDRIKRVANRFNDRLGLGDGTKEGIQKAIEGDAIDVTEQLTELSLESEIENADWGD